MRFTEFLLTENKQEIVNLGFPPIIAKLMVEKYGKHAFLLSRWYRDLMTGREETKNWWIHANRGLFSQSDLVDLVSLHDSTKDSDSYKKQLSRLELSDDQDFYSDYELEYERQTLRQQIAEDWFSNYFFKSPLVAAIEKGTVKDVAPYRDLSFHQAEEKFERKNVFQNVKPLRSYGDGYRWINVGSRCNFVGSLMANCGSAGVMGNDPNRTILTLFDGNDKPHVMVTWSPNQKRISSERGVAHSEVKEKYHEYVLDLVRFLGAELDANTSKSKLLLTKYRFGDRLSNIERIGGDPPYSEYFSITTKDGKRYVSDGSYLVAAEELGKLNSVPLVNKTGNMVRDLFVNMNALQKTISFVRI